MALQKSLLKILACPKCHGELEYVEKPESLVCNACKLRYAVTDGIPVLLVDEAEAVKE